MREHCIKIRAKAHQAVPFQTRSTTCRTLRRQDALQDESRQAKLSGSQTVYSQKVRLVLNATTLLELHIHPTHPRHILQYVTSIGVLASVDGFRWRCAAPLHPSGCQMYTFESHSSHNAARHRLAISTPADLNRRSFIWHTPSAPMSHCADWQEVPVSLNRPSSRHRM